MRVLLVGATGYIGSAIARRLSTDGDTVVAVSRRPAKVGHDVHEVRFGDLEDVSTLRHLVTDDIDAVVHAATPSGHWERDRDAADALLRPLHGSGRAFVYLSGVWVLGPTQDGDEFASPSPIRLVSGREVIEEVIRDARMSGVRAVVVRPGVVHGAGAGIPGLMVNWAAEAGTGRFVGDPSTTWPMVHRDDLADLVALALRDAPAGAVLHGVGEPAVSVAELAKAAHRAAGGDGQSVRWTQADAAEVLGADFAEALALSQRVEAPVAKALGWAPRCPGAVEDVTAYPLPAVVAAP